MPTLDPSQKLNVLHYLTANSVYVKLSDQHRILSQTFKKAIPNPLVVHRFEKSSAKIKLINGVHVYSLNNACISFARDFWAKKCISSSSGGFCWWNIVWHCHLWGEPSRTKSKMRLHTLSLRASACAIYYVVSCLSRIHWTSQSLAASSSASTRLLWRQRSISRNYIRHGVSHWRLAQLCLDRHIEIVLLFDAVSFRHKMPHFDDDAHNDEFVREKQMQKRDSWPIRVGNNDDETSLAIMYVKWRSCARFHIGCSPNRHRYVFRVC